MTEKERRPCPEDKIRGSLNPSKIAKHLGGGVERLMDIPIHKGYLSIVAVLQRWRITILNEEQGFVTEIYIDPQKREVSVFRHKEGVSASHEVLKMPFPNQDESFVFIRRVNRVEYLDNGRVKFVKRGRGTTGGIDVFRSGKVELKGDPRLFLSGRKRSENVDYTLRT